MIDEFGGDARVLQILLDLLRVLLIHGLLRGLPWETTGRIASLLGAIKIAHRGTQNHRFTMDEFRDQYLVSFGTAL